MGTTRTSSLPTFPPTSRLQLRTNKALSTVKGWDFPFPPFHRQRRKQKGVLVPRLQNGLPKVLRTRQGRLLLASCSIDSSPTMTPLMMRNQGWLAQSLKKECRECLGSFPMTRLQDLYHLVNQ